MPYWPFLLSIPLFLLPVSYFVWLYVMYRRPPVHDVAVVTQFDPPADVAPIEAALLLDGALKPRALAACIVGLAQRGALDVGEEGGAVTAFRRGRTDGPLLAHEKAILAALLGGGNEATAKEAAERMHAVVKEVEHAVLADLRRKGFLAERSLSAPILFVSAAMSAVMIALASLPLFGIQAATGIFASLVLMAQFAYVAATWRPRLTGRGKEATLKLMGFRDWLTQVEGDYIVWLEKEHKRLNDYAPYAIVFGISLTWATKLQKVTGALLKNVL